jgi:hypothetical protein
MQSNLRKLHPVKDIIINIDADSRDYDVVNEKY